MVDQYILKNVRLCQIPYELLLVYHCPLGNSIKMWTSPYMLAHILTVRNDIQILELSQIIIQIRKALNAIHGSLMYRGAFLIYCEAYNNIRLNFDCNFTFINSWLPGIITNYKRVIKSLSFHRKWLEKYRGLYISRPQQKAIMTTSTASVLTTTRILYRGRRPKYANAPTISLSTTDSPIWVNECNNVGIPAILICDTQSNPNTVPYPIVANQRSVPFIQLIINLFSEACHQSLMFEHLHFTFYHKYLGLESSWGGPIQKVKRKSKDFNFGRYFANKYQFRKGGWLNLLKTEFRFKRSNNIVHKLGNYSMLDKPASRYNYTLAKLAMPRIRNLFFPYFVKEVTDPKHTYRFIRSSFLYFPRDILLTPLTPGPLQAAVTVKPAKPVPGYGDILNIYHRYKQILKFFEKIKHRKPALWKKHRFKYYSTRVLFVRFCRRHITDNRYRYYPYSKLLNLNLVLTTFRDMNKRAPKRIYNRPQSKTLNKNVSKSKI
jgi:small subunit ribosomal protein S2